MIFTSMRLRNFRTFYGETPEIRFSNARGKTVTLLHAVNGAGKTTFLNALTWVLYDATTFHVDQMVNRQAVRECSDGSEVLCWVELRFRNREYDQDVSYILRREVTLRVDQRKPHNVGAISSRLICQQRGASGETSALSPQNAESLVNRIIPQELSKYFFFEGENPAQLGNLGTHQKKEIAEATKKLLGVEALDRAIAHLKKASDLFEAELVTGGTAALLAKHEEKAAATRARDELNENLVNAELQLARATESCDGLRRQLADTQSARDLEDRWRHIEADLSSQRRILIDQNAALRKHVASQATSLLMSRLNGQMTTITDELRQRGELPRGIKQQFIEDLVRREVCICGTALGGGSVARESVLTWKQRAGRPETEEAVIRLGAHMQLLAGMEPEFWERVAKLRSEIAETTAGIEDAEVEVEKIKDSLRDSDVAVVAGLARQLENMEQQRDEHNQHIGRLKLKIEERETVIKKLTAEIEKMAKQARLNEVADIRMKAADLAAELATEWRAKFGKNFRAELERTVQKIFDDIAIVQYKVVLNDDFSVDLVTTDGWPAAVDASRGESQVLSLAFLGGIIEETRRYYRQAERMGEGQSVQYPIVMDAPFGQLDPGHRRHVAAHLSRIADQVITLVTPTQYRGEVAEAINELTGKHYLIKYYTTRADFRDRHPGDYVVEVNGVERKLVEVSSTGFEYSAVEEV